MKIEDILNSGITSNSTSAYLNKSNIVSNDRCDNSTLKNINSSYNINMDFDSELIKGIVNDILNSEKFKNSSSLDLVAKFLLSKIEEIMDSPEKCFDCIKKISDLEEKVKNLTEKVNNLETLVKSSSIYNTLENLDWYKYTSRNNIKSSPISPSYLMGRSASDSLISYKFMDPGNDDKSNKI